MSDRASTADRRRLGIACGTLVLWTLVTIFGVGVRSDPIELEELTTSGIAWQVLAAGLLLVAVIAWRRWRDMGFRAPMPGTLRLLWLPGLILMLLVALLLALGLPAPVTVLLVLVNTLLVGFSEEVMFRGVLFRALLARLSIWPAVLWTTAAFGGVHVFNGFLTGHFALAALQAVAASCTGLMLMAIVLRTGSLWVAIVLHAAWDWVTFLVVLSAGAQSELQEVPGGGAALPELSAGQLVIPFLLVLPNLLYGLWLLRRIHLRPAAAVNLAAR